MLMIATTVDLGVEELTDGGGRREEGRTWFDTTCWIWHIFFIHIHLWFLDFPARISTSRETQSHGSCTIASGA